jgi:hypothetical protein
MPKASRETVSKIEDYGPLEERREDFEDTTIQFLTTHEDLDATPLMKGLPDDRCSSPHWGYVFKGRLTFDCGDHEEVFEAGDAFYLPPGHIPTSSEPGTEYLQFSPTKELDVVSDVIMRNVQQMQEQ